MRLSAWCARAGVVVGLGGLLALGTASTAGAEITGPCDGSVTIDGVPYGPENDTQDNPIIVPKDAQIAEWEGSTDIPIHNHQGEVWLVLGPGQAPIDNWSGENADDETTADGTYQLDEFFGLFGDIVGIYEIGGEHIGDEDSCSGSVFVKFEGNPLTTPVGIGAAGLTLLTGAGVVRAGFARRAPR